MVDSYHFSGLISVKIELGRNGIEVFAENPRSAPSGDLDDLACGLGRGEGRRSHCSSNFRFLFRLSFGVRIKASIKDLSYGL